MNFGFSLLLDLFTGFIALAGNFWSWISRPVFSADVIQFLDEHLTLQFLFDVLGIDTWGDITGIWLLTAGVIGILVYNLISWLIDILP